MGDDEEERKPRMIGGRVLRGATPDVAPAAAPPSAPPQQPPRRAAVVSADDYEAKGQAKRIVEEAHREAARIIEQANVEKVGIFEKAVEDAKAEVAASTSEELARAKMQAGQLLGAMEGEIVALALAISNKIIGRDLEREPGLVAEIAATAIEHARAAKALVLRVNPKDGAYLRENRKKLMEFIGRTLEISIRDDADVEQGGCVIQTEFGTIDAQLKTQYTMLQNLLIEDTAKREVK